MTLAHESDDDVVLLTYMQVHSRDLAMANEPIKGVLRRRGQLTVWAPESTTSSFLFRPFAAKFATRIVAVSLGFGRRASTDGSACRTSTRPMRMSNAPPPILSRHQAGMSATTSAKEKALGIVLRNLLKTCNRGLRWRGTAAGTHMHAPHSTDPWTVHPTSPSSGTVSDTYCTYISD
jgi:hypothetical protein